MTALAGARVLVTGGAGFIGSAIVDHVLDEGVEEVIVLDNLVRGNLGNLEPACRSGRVRLREGDIADQELLARLSAGIDVVFHEAAIRITQCAIEPRLALEVMVDGAYNVFEAAVAAGVGKVVTASSASIYGMAGTFPTVEGHHGYDNRTIYGAAKMFNEGLLRSFNEMFGLEYLALRYFNAYGPRMDIHGVYTEVLVRWMERIAAGMPPLILGDGRQTMDFVYVDDIARANVLAAQGDVSDEVLNVASGVETSLAELAAALVEVMGSDVQPEFGPERSVNPVLRRLAGTSKARDLIGFESQVDLHEGLERLVGWWVTERSGGCLGVTR